MNSSKYVNIFANLELGDESEEGVVLQVRCVRQLQVLVLEVAVEQQPQLVLRRGQRRVGAQLRRCGAAGRGEHQQQVEGAELDVVPHDVAERVQRAAEVGLVLPTLRPRRHEHQLVAVALDAGNIVPGKLGIKRNLWDTKLLSNLETMECSCRNISRGREGIPAAFLCSMKRSLSLFTLIKAL